MSSIFVTGGSGFIGRHVLTALAKANHRLYVLVRSEAKLVEALKDIGWDDFSLITPVRGDLTKPALGLSPSDLQLLLADVDVIVHAGGPMDILLDAEQARQVFADAAREIANLAKQIHQSGEGLKHFIHVVGFKSPYSDHDNGSTLSLGQQSDQDHSHAHSKEPAYEQMKFHADLSIRQAMHTLGVPLSVVNPSAVIGDSYSGITEQTGGVGLLVDAVRKNLMALTPGGRDHWLPLVHVDHVAALIAALAAETDPASNTYFLLDRKTDSPDIVELVRLIAREVRTNAPAGSVPHGFIKALLNTGASKLLQLPVESLDFIVHTEFPTASKQDLAAKYKLDLSISRSTLPFVVADLDYRLSHGALQLPRPFRWNRRADLAIIELGANRGGSDTRVDEGGSPIVILHGTFSSAYTMLPMARQLSELNRPLYLVDLPGFGRSPYHHNRDVLAGFEQAVADLIRSLGTDKVTVIGHSFGGYLAARMLDTMPDRIDKAVLLQPVLQPISPLYKSALLNRTWLSRLSPGPLKKAMLRGKGFHTADEIPAAYIPYVREELKSPRVRKTTADLLSALADSSRFMLDPTRWDDDKVSILWGSRDVEFDVPGPFRDLPVTYMPYAHQSPISHPEAVARYVRGEVQGRVHWYS